MKSIFYCVCNEYDSPAIMEWMKEKDIPFSLHKEVIHVNRNKIDMFIFPYGCIIFWGGGKKDCEKFIKEIKNFEIKSLSEPIIDETEFDINKSEDTKIIEEEDFISLESNDALIKLSFSYAFAQSVKLMQFEKSVYTTIDKTKYLTEELAMKGKTSLSRHKLSKEIGRLFVERNKVNLHSDILDTPKFFWRRPSYELYYIMACEYMDIDTRLDILNKRLDVIHELYQMLSEELKHIHSSILEMTIIILIVIEVLLVIMKDFK